MTAARVLVGFVLLLGAVFPLELGKTDGGSMGLSASSFLQLTLLILSISLIYLIVFQRIQNILMFAYIQILIDIILEGLVIFSTGGAISPFSILFLFTIIYSSLVLPGRPHFIFATLAGLMYIWLILAQLFKALPATPFIGLQPTAISRSYLIYIISVNMCGFYAVAALSNAIAGRLKRSDEMLMQEVDRFDDFRSIHQNIVHSLKTGLVTLSPSGHVTFMNNFGQVILGISGEEAKQAQYSNVFPEVFADAIRGLIQRPETASELTQEFHIRRENRRLAIAARATVLYNHRGERRGILVDFSDVSRFREMEGHKRMADRWAGVAELAANMAHEIRNPLAAISGSIQMLHSSIEPTGRNARLLEIILRESQRLNTIITQFLDLSRPNALELKRCEMNALVDEILVMVENDPQRHEQLRIGRNFSVESLWLTTDYGKLKQVLWNLVRNAIEAMPTGGTLTVETSTVIGRRIPTHGTGPADSRTNGVPMDDNQPFLWIVVRDTGRGISPEQIDHIFTPFTSFKERGTGLGLAISYKIIQQLNGNIFVESEVGKGSSFHVLLPVGDESHP